jgi:cysteine desulfurase
LALTSYYFDNNATTRVLPEVLEAMLPWFTEHYGNASSSHQFGQFAKEALMTARASVAKFLHASPAEIVFTSGATESNHMAIMSALAIHPTRRRIVTSAVEHSSTLQLLDELAKTGVDVIHVPVNAKGELNIAFLKAAVTKETALVTLMHANNETGVIFPIAEVANIAHEEGALFHTDAAQTAGKIALDVTELTCDFLSFSGHKLHAPKGIGVIFVKKGITAKSIIHGHQERNRRGGTENQTGIIGLGIACQLAHQAISDPNSTISSLRNEFEQTMLKTLPFVSVNGTAPRVPNTTNLCFSGLHGEELLHKLNKAGVMASLGSACTAVSTEPSHVLLAMGLSREDALSSIRLSLSKETTENEVKMLTNIITKVTSEMCSTVTA